MKESMPYLEGQAPFRVAFSPIPQRLFSAFKSFFFFFEGSAFKSCQNLWPQMYMGNAMFKRNPCLFLKPE